MLPDYVIVGAQAAGTTALFRYLRRHPLIMRSKLREAHYFDYRFDRPLSWYRALFPTRGHARFVGAMRGGRVLTGDCTPAYMFYPQAIRRMAEVLPDIKLIVLLRDPVARAYSQYQKMVRAGWADGESFEQLMEDNTQDALHAEWLRMAEDESYNNWDVMLRAIRTRGHYADQIQTLLNHYPSDRVLVIQSEAMFLDTPTVYRHVLDYLGLPPFTPSNLDPQNVGQYDAAIAESTQQRLRRYYAPHNDRLAELLGVRFEWPACEHRGVTLRTDDGKPRVVYLGPSD